MPDFDAISKARPEGLRVGAVITLAAALRRARGQEPVPAGTLLVVFADKFDKINVTVIGGDTGGAYWRVPVAGARITIVDPATLKT